MRVQGLGVENGRLYAVLLGWAALLSWHNIVSGWWSSRPQRWKDACGGSESCGEDCIRLCALVHTGCIRQNRFSATPTARPTGFAVDVEDQDFRVHRRARAKYLKTENVWGVEESVANKGSVQLQHFIIIGHCNCLFLVIFFCHFLAVGHILRLACFLAVLAAPG